MPRKSAATPRWVDDTRGLIKSQHGLGWGIREQSGKVKLTRRWADGTSSSVMLPLAWLPTSATEILRQIDAIRSKIDQSNLSLAEAARLQAISGSFMSPSIEPHASDLGIEAIDWELLADEFRAHKTNHTGDVQEATFDRMYGPVIRQALDALKSRPIPRGGKELLVRLRDVHRGEPGSRGRQLRIQYTAQLLRFAVEVKGCPRRWLPPASLSSFIGKKQKADRDGTPIKDEDLLQLLACIPDQRWYRAVALLACFGLRPVELRHCHPSSDGQQLVVNYQKRTSRGSTLPRSVYGIDPLGLPGLSQQLLDELVHGGNGLQSDLLPPLGRRDRDAASAVSTYLRRRKLWINLRSDAHRRNENITVYSFRHGYALRAHQVAGISPRVTASLMGHSLQTHHRDYGKWCDADTVSQAVAKARQNLAVAYAL